MSYYKTKTAANRRAKEVRKQMRQPKLWKIRTWNNTDDWHFTLQCGNVSLSESRYGSTTPTFFTLISRTLEEVGVGEPVWTEQRCFSHKDPQEVVDHDVAYMLKVSEQLARETSEAIRLAKTATDRVNAGEVVTAIVWLNDRGRLNICTRDVDLETDHEVVEFNSVDSFYEVIEEIADRFDVNLEDVHVLFSSSIDFPKDYTKSKQMIKLCGVIRSTPLPRCV